MSEKRIKCPACEGMGCLNIAVRSGIDEWGNHYREYPVCGFCNGERYIAETLARSFEEAEK